VCDEEELGSKDLERRMVRIYPVPKGAIDDSIISDFNIIFKFILFRFNMFLFPF